MSKKNGKMIFLVSFIIISLGLITYFLYSGVTSNNNNIYFNNFENNDIGSIPDEFTGTGRRFEEVQVVQWNKTDGHYGKVVEIGYFEERELFGTELSILFEKSVKGIIEFDVFNEIGGQVYLDICQEDFIYDPNDDICIRMPRANRDHITAMNRLGLHDDIIIFEKETWYSIKIEFDVETGWDLLIVALEFNTFDQFQFYHQPSYFSQLYFATYVLNSQFFIDNIRISLLELYEIK